MSKKLKEDTTIEEDLSNISAEINKLGNSTKLKDILKKHKDTRVNISLATEKISKIEELFDSEIEEPANVIDDETYEKYSKEITEAVDIDVNEFGVETLVKKYRSIAKKIFCCENYLKSKKMEIIYCDKTENTNNDDHDNDNSEKS